MPKGLSHTACFAHFGTKPRNVQWSWSARNEATKVVAVTLWQHEFTRADGVMTYERGPRDTSDKVRHGHTELMQNLRWALDHAEGRVHVIVAIAKDKFAKTKSIKECAPTKMIVHVDRLDEHSGAFKLVAQMGPPPVTQGSSST